MLEYYEEKVALLNETVILTWYFDGCGVIKFHNLNVVWFRI